MTMTDADYVSELRSYGMLSTNKAADHIEALTADNARLRAAFRVNMLRFVPGVTHADIDAVISAALNAGKEANG